MTQIVRDDTTPTPVPRVRVLIADADLRARVRLKRWLEQHGSFEVAEEVTDGVQAVAAARLVRPALAVLDLAMPRMHGLEAAAEIRRLLPDTRIVVRSAFSAERMAQAAIDAGADVYVQKTAERAELLDVLQGLAAPEQQAAVPDQRSLTWPSEATELLEAIVVSSPVGAVLLDGSGRVVIANPVADRLLGGSAVMGAGSATRTLHRADTQEPVQVEDLPLRAACEGTPFDDVELFVADGHGVGGTYVKISGRPVLSRQGAPTGAVISVQDDTATKEAQQALAATHEELRRSNTELANFASTASHDLSQPLHMIQGFAELLQEQGLAEGHAREYVDKIVVASQRMRTLIKDLLTYSRLTSEARPFEEVALNPVVADVVDLFEGEVAETGASIHIDPLPTVLADPTQLRQLFQNLIGNALTYVASGVTPSVRVAATRGSGEWQVSVTDNGIGISREDRQRAFAMFQRLVTSEEYAGTGIGLAVCARIIERHGGRIWIDDSPDGGSTIRFTLPDRPGA